MGRLDVLTLTNGAFAENCYFLVDRDSTKAVLVDPGEEADLFLRRAVAEGIEVQSIWLTHAHADHIAGVGSVVDALHIPVYLHPADRPLYDAFPQQSAWLGLASSHLPTPDGLLSQGDVLPVGELRFQVRHAPGHSPGSVVFVGHGVAMVGDVLFAGSVGRTDLPGGNAATLLASIRDALLTLPDDTRVFPGHGPETTIGRERLTNPFVTGAVRLA